MDVLIDMKRGRERGQRGISEEEAEEEEEEEENEEEEKEKEDGERGGGRVWKRVQSLLKANANLFGLCKSENTQTKRPLLCGGMGSPKPDFRGSRQVPLRPPSVTDADWTLQAPAKQGLSREH